ncbi:hypothetical protein K461DRAFT_278008 [Myriangium duriaei CBS 260.36]|uniref:Uncharacterized protein n=1 Tax=Myriangium duriaei CBS 260.36 TaxID=1168546 RepID=A0A9P4MG55_9PEZI|nr:hypothetical protein K461DRAFT_278008 [Myriangium duriaei CBS 260.36]
MQPATSYILNAMRHYSNPARMTTRGDRVRANAVLVYCCLAFSAPFAGAAEMSRRTAKDGRCENMRPLSFRDCMRSSPLDDYAGLGR